MSETLLNMILNTLALSVTPGMTTKALDGQAEALCNLHQVRAAFKGYKPINFGGENGYPATVCVSINEEVIHGIPSDRKIQDGDVVKIDMGIVKDDQFDDGAITVLAGKYSSAAARKLVKATQEALIAGVAQAKAGKTTHDIAIAISAVAKQYDVHVIHGYGGHGIGTALHMEPHVPNELDGSPAVTLEPGMRIAIEPMFGSNHGFTHVAKDGWTVKLQRGGLAAHFEQTVTIE